MSPHEIYFENIEQLATKRIGVFQENVILSLHPQMNTDDWKEQLNQQDEEIKIIFIIIEDLKSIKGLPNHFLINKLKNFGIKPSDYNKQKEFEKYDFSKDFSFEMNGRTYYIFEASQKGPRVVSSTRMQENKINSSQGKLIEHLLKSQPGDLDWRKEFLDHEMFGEYRFKVQQLNRDSTLRKLYPHQGKSCQSDGPMNPIQLNPASPEDAKTIFSFWSKGILKKNGKTCLGREDVSVLWKYIVDEPPSTNEVWRTLQPLIVDYLSEVLNLKKKFIVQEE